MFLPEDKKRFIDWAADTIAACRVSCGNRAALARSLKQWLYTGSDDGEAAIYNRLQPHIDRMASYLFSPTDLRFHIEFENHYPKATLSQAEVGGRVLSREFERRKVDMQFSDAVYLALNYGACIPKIMDGHDGVNCKLVMPWQFGVYREDLNELSDQEAVCETSYITKYDLWRRISHLPDAEDLFKRAVNYAKKSFSPDETQTYMHSVMLAGNSPIVQTAAPFTSQPGGMINVTTDPDGAVLSPDVIGELIMLHELWAVDDRTGDYTTVQMVEPDIIIAPRFRRKNLFVSGYLPYTLVQPNRMQGYFWGRPELSDLMKLQGLLKERMDDVRRVMSLQYDRMLAFIGFNGMNDEMYDQFREAGWISSTEGNGKVEDLTPKMPENAFTEIEAIIRFMDEVSGFSNILSGQGEPGVRAGNHAQTLLRTASPRLRDRALIVERQCGDLGDKVFELLCAKDAKQYWTDSDKPDEKAEFLLSQLPDDRRVVVDSHSSSPIYEQDHTQITAFLAKLGVINGESILDMLPSVPLRDLLKQRFRDQQAARAKFIAEHPEIVSGPKKKPNLRAVS